MDTPFKRTFRTPGMNKIYRPPNVIPEETIDCDQLWTEDLLECHRKYAKELLQLEQGVYQIGSDEDGELEHIFLRNLSAVLCTGKIKHTKSVADRERVRRTSSLKRSKPVDKIDGSRLRLTMNDQSNQFLKVEMPDDPSFLTRPRANIYEVYEDNNNFVSEDFQPLQSKAIENQKLNNVSVEVCQTDNVQGREKNLVETEKPTIVVTLETPSILPNFPSPLLKNEQTNNDLSRVMPETLIEREVTISQQFLRDKKEDIRLEPEQNSMKETSILTESKRNETLHNAASDPLTALLDQDQQDLNQNASALFVTNQLKKIPQNDTTKKDIPTDSPKFGPPSSYRSFRKSPLNKVQSVDTAEYIPDTRRENSLTSTSLLLRSNFQRKRPSSFSLFDKRSNDLPSMSDRLRNFSSRNVLLSKDTISEAPINSSNTNIQKDEVEISHQQTKARQSERSSEIPQSSQNSLPDYAENKLQTSEVLSSDGNALVQNQSDKFLSPKAPFQTPSEVSFETSPTSSGNSPKTPSELTSKASSDIALKALPEPLAAIITNKQLDDSFKIDSPDFPPMNVKKSSLLSISSKSVDDDLPKFGPPSSYSSLRGSKLGRFQSVDSHKYIPNSQIKNDDKTTETLSSQWRKTFAQNKPSSFSVADKQYDLPVIYNRFRSNNLSKDTVNEVSRASVDPCSPIDRQIDGAPNVLAEREKMKKQTQFLGQRREPSLTGVVESGSSMSQRIELSTDTLKQNQTIRLSVSDTSSEKLTSKPILERTEQYSKPVSPVVTPNDPLKTSPAGDSSSKNDEFASTTFVRRGSQRTISNNLLNRLRNFEKSEEEQNNVPRKNQALSRTSSSLKTKPSTETIIKAPNESLAATPSEPVTRIPIDKLIKTPSETLMQRFDRNRPGSFSVGDRQFEVSKNERSSSYRVHTPVVSNDVICEATPKSPVNNNIQNKQVTISGSVSAATYDPIINMDINGVVIRNKPKFEPKYGPPSSYKRLTNRGSNEIADSKAFNESNDHSNISPEIVAVNRSSKIDTLKAKFGDQIDRTRPGSFSTRDVTYDPLKYGPPGSNRLVRSNTDNRSTTLKLTPDVSKFLQDNVTSVELDATISSSDDSIEMTHRIFPNSEKPSDLRKFNRLPLNYRLRRSGHMPRVSSTDTPDINLLPLSQIDQNIDLSASETPEDKIINNFRRTRPNVLQASDIKYRQPASSVQSESNSIVDQNEQSRFTRKWNSPPNTSISLQENKQNNQTIIIQPVVAPRNDLNNNYERTSSVLSNVRNEPVLKYNQADSRKAVALSSQQPSSNVRPPVPDVLTYSSRTSLQLTKPSPEPVDGASLLMKAADSILGTVQRKISIFNYRDLIRAQSVSDKRTEFDTNRARTTDQLQAGRLGQSFNVQR